MYSKKKNKEKIDVLMAYHSCPRKKSVERDLVMILPLKIGNKRMSAVKTCCI